MEELLRLKSNSEYIIPFVGLKIGKHTFDFKLNDKFFDSFEFSIIHKGDVDVELVLEKKETMLIGDYTIKGIVVTECDRCNDPVSVPVSGKYQLVYKFGDEPSNDESLVIVYPDQIEIDVSENMLEFVTVSLPNRTIHELGECNEEMIEILNDYVLVSEDELAKDDESDEDSDDSIGNDPRWEALKKLKK